MSVIVTLKNGVFLLKWAWLKKGLIVVLMYYLKYRGSEQARVQALRKNVMGNEIGGFGDFLFSPWLS